MISTILIKHGIMRILGAVHRPSYEYIRFLIMRRWWPNLVNPTTISEWLLRRKLYQTLERPELCGKHEGYNFARTTCDDLAIPDVVATLAIGESLPQDLPKGHYVVKGSHGSGMISPLFVADEATWTPSRSAIKEQAARWLRTDYSKISGEPFYADAERLVIFERSLTRENEFATDIKIHCVKGVPRVFQFLDRRQDKVMRFTWKILANETLQPVDYFVNEFESAPDVIDAALTKQSIQYARELSAAFEYVRVDLMLTHAGHPIFGELTFVPHGGCMPLKTRVAEEDFFNHCWPVKDI